MNRQCEQCGDKLPVLARRHARTCSSRCRQRAYRARRSLPRELTSRANWVRRDEEKVPLRADNGRNASATNPATWTTYSNARRSAHGVGLGYALRKGDGLVCVDLDDCIDATGRLSDAARRFIDSCPSTFVEVSASGTGLHVWGYGTVSRGRRFRVHGTEVEIYGQERYIAVTGKRFENAPVHFADLSEVISNL